MYFNLKEGKTYINELGMELKGVSNFLCEEEEDIKTLPIKDIGIGSRALVITTGHIYILGPSYKWLLYKGVSILE